MCRGIRKGGRLLCRGVRKGGRLMCRSGEGGCFCRRGIYKGGLGC